jgi:hypothetical protein
MTAVGHHTSGLGMRATRVALVGVGCTMMLFGAVSAVTNHGFHAFRQITFLAVALVAHDGFLLPVFLLAGFLVHRLLPRRHRAIVQAALIATAAVTLVALPAVLGYGRIADNASVLPRNYIGGYWLVIGAIWLVAAVVLGLTTRRRRDPRTPPDAPD